MRINHQGFTQKYTQVYCEDEQRFNAPHHFQVTDVNGNLLAKIDFQEGPIKETGVNGIANEDALLMVLTRLEAFQNSPYRCKENHEAILAINEAIKSLRSRTMQREVRGVEGTNQI